jgi:hypothetical protein
MATAGRPTKLTPELAKRILDSIRAGNYLETSAAFAGISKVTLFEWLKRGHTQKTGIHRDFLRSVEKALAEAEVRDVLIITQAAQKAWQAAAWRLERKFPARWGRKPEVGSTGSTADRPRPWSPGPNKP